MSDTDNRWEFKVIAEKILADEDITDYQRGYCHGQIDAADTMSEHLERQNQIAKAAPEMLKTLKACEEYMLEELKEKHKVVSFVDMITLEDVKFHNLLFDMQVAITKAEGSQP
jgi:hypothetical protein